MIKATSINPVIVVVLGHPRGRESLCGALATSISCGAEQAGLDVEFLDLSAEEFNPNVKTESPNQQSLEPVLTKLKHAIDRADHVVFVYPTWWGTMPALLKGALDRVLTPGWAFEETTGGTGFEGLLRPRTAELVTTMDTPGWVYRWLYAAPGHRAMSRATLGFAGIETTRITRFGPVNSSTRDERLSWLATATRLGSRLTKTRRSVGNAVGHCFANWVRALRLQFYPMTFLAYAAGALAAAELTGTPISDPGFWLGYLVLFCLEAVTVFTNDVFDQDSDVANRNYSTFTGGSRVLIEGRLTRSALLKGAGVALVLAMICFGLLLFMAAPPVLATASIYLGLTVLALGYTIPPFKLSHRGLGEIDVAFTHSFGVLAAGYAIQNGPITDLLPVWLALPLFFSILPAIIFSGVPDCDADKAAAKNTIVVYLGIRRSVGLAILSAVTAATLAVSLSLSGVDAWRGLEFIAPIHAVLLIWLIAPRWSDFDHARRIDGVMATALLYIGWFVVVPVINLAN